jgi:hypothetical protein
MSTLSSVTVSRSLWFIFSRIKKGESQGKEKCHPKSMMSHEVNERIKIDTQHVTLRQNFEFFFFFPSLQNLRGGMEGTSTEEGLLMREIEDLPVVSSLSFIRTIRRDKTGYRANLRYDCGVNQVGPIRMSRKRPTLCD